MSSPDKKKAPYFDAPSERPDTQPANNEQPSETATAEQEPPEPAPTQPPAEERIAKLEADLAEARDRMLRALAETENVRRRLEREREDTARYAISRFAGDV